MILEDFVIKEMGLSPGLYDKLMNACDEVILKKKEFLLHQGQICSFIGFVKAGVLRSYIEKEGEDFISDFYCVTLKWVTRCKICIYAGRNIRPAMWVS